MGLLLVLDAGCLSRQGGGFSGCLLPTDGLSTLQERLREARLWCRPRPMMAPWEYGVGGFSVELEGKLPECLPGSCSILLLLQKGHGGLPWGLGPPAPVPQRRSLLEYR